ncbi:class II fructose-bisphosphate aldolase [Christensenellaceae bacterium NSJ-44]|uniref:Class II fructose-bisphosphate aldolase n=1 Tax=Luoshenia tenuis TaxID=2763654 RepID=A0A926D226_9FIRM|nr:class II fructose-bisphosphate aldolase [Luoshenia tenuis]MBC8530056.1 class II fructose-bisphosphate aldolase [Luoshenia tenuis]SCJ72469.1 Probable fructose-bisphosphate aldolase [uncultured Clostridium sp.]
MALATLNDLIKITTKNKNAVGMFNVINYEYAVAMINAAEQVNYPIMLGVPEGFVKNYYDLDTMTSLLKYLATTAKVPVAIHLDHSKTFETTVKCMRAGFTSVMFDGSALTYEENVEQTAEIVKIAHAMGVSVEGELGYVGRNGVDQIDPESFTKVEQAVDFVKRTGVDALAIAVGNLHGNYSFEPKLDFDRIKAIKEATGVGLVLHGGSGIADDDFRKAAELGIDKVNIFTEILDFGKKFTLENLPDMTFLQYSKALADAMTEVVKYRMEVFTCGRTL